MESSIVETRRVRLSPVPSIGSSEVQVLLEGKDLRGSGGLDDLIAFLPENSEEVAAQFIIENALDGSEIGFCSFSRIDSKSETIQVDIHVDAESTHVGVTFEATMLIVNYAFANWGVQKVHVWSTGERADTLTMRAGVIREAKKLPDGVRIPNGAVGARLFVVEQYRWEHYGIKFLNLLTRHSGQR